MSLFGSPSAAADRIILSLQPAAIILPILLQPEIFSAIP